MAAQAQGWAPRKNPLPDSALWHRVQWPARPQRSEDVSPGEPRPGPTIPRGRWARAFGAGHRSLEVSAGTEQRMTAQQGPRIPLLLSPLPDPVAQSQGAQARTAERAGRPPLRGLRQSPAEPRASRPPIPSPPPTAGRALTDIGERPGGQRAASAQEPQGPEQRQPHGSGAPAGRGQQVLGRAPRSPGRRVCLAHPAAPRSHQAPPRPAPSRPRPAAAGQAPPPGRRRPRPRRARPRPRTARVSRPRRSPLRRTEGAEAGSDPLAPRVSRGQTRPRGPAALPRHVGGRGLRTAGQSPGKRGRRGRAGLYSSRRGGRAGRAFTRRRWRRRCCRCRRRTRAPRAGCRPGTGAARRPSTAGSTRPRSPASGTRRRRASRAPGTRRSGGAASGARAGSGGAGRRSGGGAAGRRGERAARAPHAGQCPPAGAVVPSAALPRWGLETRGAAPTPRQPPPVLSHQSPYLAVPVGREGSRAPATIPAAFSP